MYAYPGLFVTDPSCGLNQKYRAYPSAAATSFAHPVEQRVENAPRKTDRTKKPRSWQQKWRKMDSSKNCFKQLGGTTVGLGTGKWLGVMHHFPSLHCMGSFLFKAVIRSFLCFFCSCYSGLLGSIVDCELQICRYCDDFGL